MINLVAFENSLTIHTQQIKGTLARGLGPNSFLKMVAFLLTTFIAIYLLNDLFFRLTYWKCLLFIEPILLFFLYQHLKKRQELLFREQFPDALNILASAITSGQGIMQGFEYVGEQLNNSVGEEFKYMAKRFQIGEDPEIVLARSSLRFPYLEYFFFISTIRVNITRGGQLKEVITRINRLIFASRNIEKKKDSLTSEARMSAKIIGFLPLVFLGILYVTNVDNYNFVMYEEAGRGIFYYVLISEIIGFAMIRTILGGVSK
ncbi:pilus assembly protein TadB [Shewanella sairae]|uniref:Pilus assembly protein TadB n=1 Tax=Shewanella sairae TaxID=190310 RepID=A0ABQ4PQF0_9GAMM|nr:pilus assembly protein TadB [Shewanella sairae]